MPKVDIVRRERISTQKKNIYELQDKGLAPYLICRKLKLSKGTVAGAIYRRAHPWVKKQRSENQDKKYFHRYVFDLDNFLDEKVKEYINDMKVSKSEAIRTLLYFGLESLEGE